MRQRGWPFPAQGSGMELTLKKSSYGIAGALGHAGEKPQSERKKRCSAALFISHLSINVQLTTIRLPAPVWSDACG